jgi:integrase
MGKLFKRGDTYYADLRDTGRGKRSLHTTDKIVAKARLREAELAATDAAPHPPKPLMAAIDDMISSKRATTAESYKWKALHLCRILGEDTDINSLTRAQIANFVKQRRAEGAKSHSIHKELVVLRQALKEALVRDEFFGSPDVVPSIKAEYEPQTRWLTVDEFKALLGAVAPNRRTWLMIQTYTGAELGAMQRLTWEHVNLERGTITIPGTKRSSRFRVDLPLHPTLHRWLSRCCRTAPLVPPWPTVHSDMRLACKLAGIDPPATTHDLRRTFGSWLVQGGVDIHHVARLMGNTYNMAARVYGQTSDASYAAAVSKLPPLSKKPSKPRRRKP